MTGRDTISADRFEEAARLAERSGELIHQYLVLGTSAPSPSRAAETPPRTE